MRLYLVRFPLNISINANCSTKLFLETLLYQTALINLPLILKHLQCDIEPVSMRLALSTKPNQKALSSPSSIKVYLETLSMRLAVLSPDTFKLDAMSHSVSRLPTIH